MSAAEEWRVVAAFPDYAVSSHGRVKRIVPRSDGRLRRAPRAGTVTKTGYRQITLWKGGRQFSVRVHKIVCAAFHGAPPSGLHIVAHGDGDPLNNAASNLRWATAQENEADKRRHGTVARGEKQGAAKLSAADVRAIRADNRPQRTVAADFGVTQANVHQVVSRKSWRHVA